LSYGVELAKKLASTTKPVRVAIVANMIKMAASASGAADLFRQVLNQAQFPDTAIDLTLQLNVSRTVDQGQINRLCRWATTQMQLLAVQIGPDGVATPVVTAVEHGLALMADVNTAPTFDLNDANLAFDLLAAEVAEIISSGYARLTAA